MAVQIMNVGSRLFALRVVKFLAAWLMVAEKWLCRFYKICFRGWKLNLRS